MEEIEKLFRETLRGKPVCIHSSYGSVKHLFSGPSDLISRLLREDCTVIAPTFSFGFNSTEHAPASIRPKRNGWDYETQGEARPDARPYDADADNIDIEDMGVLSRTILQMPGRARGKHPLCSFAAVGPLADLVISGQDGTDVFAPLERLAAEDGYVLLVGVGFDSLTLIHYAEQLAGRSPFVRWAKNPAGIVVGVRIGGCSDGFGKLEASVADIVRKREFNGSNWTIIPAKPALRRFADAIRAEPRVTHCEDPSCKRCADAVLGGPIV